MSYDSLNTPRTHRVWNEDTGWFHVMDVELTNTKQKKNIHVLQNHVLKLLFNEQQVIGYSINLNRGNILITCFSKRISHYKQTESVLDYKINE